VCAQPRYARINADQNRLRLLAIGCSEGLGHAGSSCLWQPDGDDRRTERRRCRENVTVENPVSRPVDAGKISNTL